MLRTHLFSLLCGLGLGTVATAQSFDYPDFTSVAGLAFNDAAMQASPVLRVTSAALSERGSVYYDQAVSVGGGFVTTFVFEISNPGAGGGDGMTFIIQNDPAGLTALGNHASAIGYGGFLSSPAVGIDNSLVIELDTFNGGVAWGDTDGNHISIHTGGTGDNSQHEDFSIGSYSPSLATTDLSAGQHTVRISYVPGLLQVYIDDLVTPVIAVPYDFGTGGTYLNSGLPAGGLNLIGGSMAFVGFTAGNGGSFENHDVVSWSFTSGGGLGTSYCLSTANSTGAVSTISASGSDSISANDLVLTAGNMPDQPGIFIAGPAAGQIPFFNGFLCIDVNGLQRFSDAATASGGVITEAVDLATSAPGGLNVMAGSSYFFQRWYRDPAAGGGNANFSDGIEIAYTP
ncbi:MAG: hypothetical protein E2O39_09345 [Planctomycetota bacterium]|nr:MAG: hypothetical protein E2O39_09345 [Planctomycetota bacterium]